MDFHEHANWYHAFGATTIAVGLETLWLAIAEREANASSLEARWCLITLFTLLVFITGLLS